jgi:predicted nuclease of predicted toxin-antitoxin system
MKILIDECLPRKLKNELPDHDVQTVPQAGWAGKKNGELLSLMAGVYDVFITIDNNLQDQQKLASQPVRFIVLAAVNNKLETLVPLMPDVREALKTIQPGQVAKVSDGD